MPTRVYGVRRLDGSYREFPSLNAARKFSRELPPWAMQYRKGVWSRLVDSDVWEYFV